MKIIFDHVDSAASLRHVAGRVERTLGHRGNATGPPLALGCFHHSFITPHRDDSSTHTPPGDRLSPSTWSVQEAEEGFCRGRESGIFASDIAKLPLDLEVADRHDAESPILCL